MTETKPESAIERVGKHFEIDTAEHEMTILLDQGLHRHVRFMRPKGGSSSYWYELITVPNALIFRGDFESLVFSRVEDMFGFFRSNPDRLTMRISPDYWAEKLTSDRDCVKGYSREKFEQYASDILGEVEDEWPGVTDAWREHIGEDSWNGYDLDSESDARAAMEAFRHEIDGRAGMFRFQDVWEADFRDFEHSYLWACHAIVAGIARYDEAKAKARSFPTVTLCGSMRFYPRMLEVAGRLTSAGQIVLAPHDGSLTGIANKTAIEHGAMLDEMHRAKIRMSQSVYVVNVGGYIGESTRSEIAYATELGIPVEYDFTTPSGHTDYEGTPQGLAGVAFAAESEA